MLAGYRPQDLQTVSCNSNQVQSTESQASTLPTWHLGSNPRCSGDAAPHKISDQAVPEEGLPIGILPYRPTRRAMCPQHR
jgi:hypothetical protein